MKPVHVFYERLGHDLLRHYRSIRSVVDHIVFIYCMLPAVAAIVVWQYQMWQASQMWLSVIPEALAVYILLFLLSKGSERWFVAEADLLFLRQQTGWLSAIMRYGKWYSIGRDILWIGVILLLAAPFLYIHYEWSLLHILCLWLVIMVMRQATLYARKILTMNFPGFCRRFILQVFGFCLPLWPYNCLCRLCIGMWQVFSLWLLYWERCLLIFIAIKKGVF